VSRPGFLIEHGLPVPADTVARELGDDARGALRSVSPDIAHYQRDATRWPCNTWAIEQTAAHTAAKGLSAIGRGKGIKIDFLNWQISTSPQRKHSKVHWPSRYASRCAIDTEMSQRRLQNLSCNHASSAYRARLMDTGQLQKPASQDTTLVVEIAPHFMSEPAKPWAKIDQS
jgi:hypothetical protein